MSKAAMTTNERFRRMFEHREADRVPILDGPWGTTIERWKREGLPEGRSWVDHFDLDKVATFSGSNSPGYENRTIEDTPEYRIYTTSFGATLKNWKHLTSTPEFLDFRIKDRESWAEAKERMQPAEWRIPWKRLEDNYKACREQGYWIETGLWFGFDITHSWVVGTERLLIAIAEDPEWVTEMFNHCLDLNLALIDRMIEAGYTFDCVSWPDDMGYKERTFFSLDTYREILKPVQKKAIDFAHARGMKVRLHSCGNINAFIPDLVEIGLDALNPLEVKAGIDPVALKGRFGKDLVFHGGVNAVLWDDIGAIEAEIRRILPVMMKDGGYIFATDHSIPDVVSFRDFSRIIDVVKDIGAY
jgi:uroporphyrinogen decarboxylase